MDKESHQVTIFSNDPNSSSYKYKTSVEKLQSQLSKFGLSSNQCKVYIFLGKYGSKTAPEVCRSLKLPRTETYRILTSLQNKGIVSATFQHPIQFSALPLDEMVRSLLNAEKERFKILEKQESELTELWNSIPSYHKELGNQKEDKFQILQGKNQIYGKINDMINKAKNEFLIIGTEKDFLKYYHANFLDYLGRSDIKLKILTSTSNKTKYVFEEIDKKNVKKLPYEIDSNLCFLIKDNDELLFYIKNIDGENEKFTAMWTNSNLMIYSNKLLFNSILSKSKNIS